MKTRQLKMGWRLFAVAALFSTTGAASAATFTLTAQEFDKAMPDGSLVRMWGYALPGQQPSVPGPVLRVPAGEPLTINIVNQLLQPTSVVVPGQRAASNPVMFLDATGRNRVRSFAPEAGAGANASYTWSAPQPGTYLYHSGTHAQVQVQMGLYGTVIVEAGPALAYPGVPYDSEVTLLYSEVDPALHAAVANGSYGNPAAVNPMTSTLNYAPKYFLVNGEAYTPGVTQPVAIGNAGGRTLLRLLNAGLNTRVPMVQDLDMSLVAEDGKPYPYAKTQYTAPLPALKTLDAVIVPPAVGNYPIYDRRLALSNNAVAPGGMLRMLRAGGDPIPQNDAYTLSEDVPLTAAAPGVLGNDPTAGGTLTAVLATPPANGALALAADGSFTYTPNANFNGADSFAYQLNSGGGPVGSPATVALTVTPVNDAPVAAADAATTPTNTATVVSVLANDYDVEGGAVSLYAVDNPSANGGAVSITGTTATYTPSTGFTGTDTFSYVICDNTDPLCTTGLFGIGTVTVTVQ